MSANSVTAQFRSHRNRVTIDLENPNARPVEDLKPRLEEMERQFSLMSEHMAEQNRHIDDAVTPLRQQIETQNEHIYALEKQIATLFSVTLASSDMLIAQIQYLRSGQDTLLLEKELTRRLTELTRRPTETKVSAADAILDEFDSFRKKCEKRIHRKKCEKRIQKLTRTPQKLELSPIASPPRQAHINIPKLPDFDTMHADYQKLLTNFKTTIENFAPRDHTTDISVAVAEIIKNVPPDQRSWSLEQFHDEAMFGVLDSDALEDLLRSAYAEKRITEAFKELYSGGYGLRVRHKNGYQFTIKE